jgi:hypothetical protein
MISQVCEKALVIAGMALSALALNAVLAAALAFPFMWLWNAALAPLGPPAIGYWRALGFLLLWWVLRTAGKGFKVSVKMR